MLKNKKNILSLLISFLVITVFVSPLLSFGQEGDPGPGPDEGGEGPGSSQIITIENPFKEDSIEGLIRTLVNDILIPIGAVVAVLMVMYAGFLYVTARGNPGQIKTAHDALLWSVIGAAILLGAWVISEAIQGTVNQLKS